ncbi:two-component regulator propeller domain-containing protein [Bacteroidota bacterium]
MGVGQWRDHLPYNKGVRVADAGEWIYAASESGLFKYHKRENDVVRLSKVNGLSDIGYAAIAWSAAYNTLVVAYSNTNVDLIQDGQITNLPDIKDKSILGNKSINNIHVKDNYAYLACGFAIVVIDIQKQEIKDTYYIGPNGDALNIYDIVTTESELYACTENGVYHASLTNLNLANYQNWQRFDALGDSKYNAGTWFNNRFYVSKTTSANDSIFYLENDQWMAFDSVYPKDIKSLETSENALLVATTGALFVYDTLHNQQLMINGHRGGKYAHPIHAIKDDEDFFWVADNGYGLVRVKSNWNGKVIEVNGPSGFTSTDISIWDGRCYVASGGISSTWAALYNGTGMYTYKDNEWEAIAPSKFPETKGLRDYLRVLVDPFDSKRVYATAWEKGLVEYYDDEFVAFYDTTNNVLQGLIGMENNVRVSGMQIDRNTGTLWISGAGSNDLLYAKSASGEWYSYKIDGIGSATLADIAIDNVGQKWIVAPRGVGLVVYKDNGTLGDKSDDESIKLGQGQGNGNLASGNVFSIAADFDGKIWVGTDNGISVFYSPENVFDGGDIDAQRVLVQQDGYTQYLLDNEGVTAIKVDGANRKWVGTEKSGVFLLSDDGTEELLHFTTENSPLFSNHITALGIDHLSGEVFIGTEKGILSYRGTATWGTPGFEKSDVYAYPNPVQPDYEGPIAIKGLVRDADVKITDAAGNVVYAAVANGGQAIWDGNRFNGTRAKSGVYLVFASNEDGKQTFVTKILFIN